ncbi:MAG: GNAT family acetyltransferase [Lachnospiraceae bacterium]|nr:GNAT family acetyltransferase [Lachnospiraceae bacterium]
MKYLIMCEGTNELKIIDILLDANKLNITRDDLIGLSAYHARQIGKSAIVQAELRMYNREVIVYRIGDRMSDKLVIPKEFKHQIKDVVKYCTLPELEMLLIVSENKHLQFEKVKSGKRAKQFAKEEISYKGKRYDNSTDFYQQYFGDDCEKLIGAIRKYKHLHHTHKNDERYLADLLN